jgi:hypothetical protein
MVHFLTFLLLSFLFMTGISTCLINFLSLNALSSCPSHIIGSRLLMAGKSTVAFSHSNNLLLPVTLPTNQRCAKWRELQKGGRSSLFCNPTDEMRKKGDGKGCWLSLANLLLLMPWAADKFGITD